MKLFEKCLKNRVWRNEFKICNKEIEMDHRLRSHVIRLSDRKLRTRCPCSTQVRGPYRNEILKFKQCLDGSRRYLLFKKCTSHKYNLLNYVWKYPISDTFLTWLTTSGNSTLSQIKSLIKSILSQSTDHCYINSITKCTGCTTYFMKQSSSRGLSIARAKICQA